MNASSESIARYAPEEVILNPADVVLTGAPGGAESSWISRWIKGVTQTPGESPTLFSHAGIIGNGGALGDATIIEMTWPKMREVSLAKNYGNGSMRIWRLTNLSKPHADTIVRAARSWKRHPWKKWYGLEKLPMFLVDSLMSKLLSRIVGHPVEFRFFSTFNLTRRLVCSQVVSRLYQIYTGTSFSMNTASLVKLADMFGNRLIDLVHNQTNLRIATDGPGVTPDDIDDFCITNSLLFAVVYGQ